MDLNALDWVLLALSSFRLTHLLVFDEIMAPLRRLFTTEEASPDDPSIILIRPKGRGVQNFLGRLISCHWCTGVWVAGGLTLVYFFFPGIIRPFLLLFSLAGAQALLEYYVQGQ